MNETILCVDTFLIRFCLVVELNEEPEGVLVRSLEVKRDVRVSPVSLDVAWFIASVRKRRTVMHGDQTLLSMCRRMVCYHCRRGRIRRGNGWDIRRSFLLPARRGISELRSHSAESPPRSRLPGRSERFTGVTWSSVPSDRL